ncbi:15358_t:CDS:2, partial [Dentiscutata heterogama]
YIVLDWNDIVKYLNDTPEIVEQKGKSFVLFLVKFVFMTFYKPLEEAFNFQRDVKYDKGEFIVNKLKTIVQGLNQKQDGKMIIKQNQLILSTAKKKPQDDHNQIKSESCDTDDS